MNNNQYKSVLSALQMFVDPQTPAVELRALGVNGDETHAGWFSGQSLEAMAKAALDLDPKSRGVYFTPNPLGGSIGGQPVGQVKRRSAGETAKDSDVSVRRWLLIDADPTRIGEDGEILDTSLPATDAENAEAYRLIDHVRAIMEGTFGFLGSVVASSGNGWHVCYPVDMANDEVSKGMHRDLLRGLDKRCTTVQASIDLKTYNAARIWKVYATKSRKGIPGVGREHRWAGMLDGGAFNVDHRLHNVERLKVMLNRWAAQDELEAHQNAPQMPPTGEIAPYARKALDMECSAVQSAGPGNRNNTLNESAFKLGTLIGGGMLDRPTVEASLMSAAVGAGLSEVECRATIRSGLDAGVKSPRVAPEKPAKAPAHVGQQPAPYESEDTKKRPLATSPDEVATIHDLKRAGAKLRWLWKGWLQIGVLNIVAAEGGCGKTRLTMDLMRRIKHGLPWPDGQPMELPADSQSLWVMSDNTHDEMVSGAEKFDIEDSIRINAHPDDPYGGVLLSNAVDLAELEARIAVVKPVFVVIDTVGNSTDLNLSKQEDAKAYYQPLQVIARRHSIALLCLTHLNANGGTLGRRGNEKVRSVIQMTKPDPDQPDRRRLWVAKSNSQVPDVLGVTMGETGNEYDLNPPVAPEDGDGKARPAKGPSRLDECKSWLRETLADATIKVKVIREQSDEKEFSSKTLYKAKEVLGIEEFEMGGYKFWRLVDFVPHGK